MKYVSKNQCTIKNVLADERIFSCHCDVNWSKHFQHLDNQITGT